MSTLGYQHRHSAVACTAEPSEPSSDAFRAFVLPAIIWDEAAMCLAIPGKVLEQFDRGGMGMARVQFGGIVREVCLDYVPAAHVGDYVLVHVGFALSTVDPEEAARTYQLLEEMDQLTELHAPVAEEVSARKLR